MLVVQRKVSETIVVGKAGDVLTGPITVMLVEVRSQNCARVGVNAQRGIAVHRGEVAAVIEQQKQ